MPELAVFYDSLAVSLSSAINIYASSWLGAPSSQRLPAPRPAAIHPPIVTGKFLVCLGLASRDPPLCPAIPEGSLEFFYAQSGFVCLHDISFAENRETFHPSSGKNAPHLSALWPKRPKSGFQTNLTRLRSGIPAPPRLSFLHLQ
jgi:hypothetical protein